MDHFKKRCQGCNTLVAQYEIVCPPCLDKRRAKAVASAGPCRGETSAALRAVADDWGIPVAQLGMTDGDLYVVDPASPRQRAFTDATMFVNPVDAYYMRTAKLIKEINEAQELAGADAQPWTVTPMDDLDAKRNEVIDALVDGVIDSAEGHRRMREIEVVRAENDRQQRMPPPGLQSGKAMMFPSRHRGRSEPVAGCTCDACKTIAACKWDNPYLSATVDAERAWRNAKLFGAGVIQKVEAEQALAPSPWNDPALSPHERAMAKVDAIVQWRDAGFVSSKYAEEMRTEALAELLKEPSP